MIEPMVEPTIIPIVREIETRYPTVWLLDWICDMADAKMNPPEIDMRRMEMICTTGDEMGIWEMRENRGIKTTRM